MKTLNEILNQVSTPNFPSIGVNGYGGEQDGSQVIYGSFQIWSREYAKKVILPDFVKLNWAKFKPGFGWTGAVGYWSNVDITEWDKKALSLSCDCIDWE